MAINRRQVILTTSHAAIFAALAPNALHARHLQGEPQSGGTLYYATTVDADSMDPHESAGLAARGVQALVFDRLVYRDVDNTFQPWLAESWEVSDDELEITFKLVEDRSFTDGTPVNAEAVKYTFDRMMEPERASSAATQFPSMSVTVDDDYTVTFTLDEPFAPFFSSLANPAGGIISPTAAEEAGTGFGQAPVGSGPFVLDSWTKDTEMSLVRNPDYSTIRADFTNTGPAYLDRLVYQIVVEDATRVNAIRTDDVQIANGSYTLAPTFTNDPDINLVVAEAGAANINYLQFNQRKAPFDDVLVRKAVGFAVDAQELLDAVYFGYGAINQTMIPTGVAGFNPEIGEEFGFTFDPDQARSLLDEAGWVLPQDGDVREKDGQKLEVELLSWTSNTIDRLTQLIQAQLADVGFDVSINLMEAGTFLAVGVEGEQNFDFMRTTWDEPIIMNRALGGGGRFENFDNPEFDALIDETATTLDWATRQELLDQANEFVLEEALALPLFTDFTILLARKNVQGLSWDASGWQRTSEMWLED